MLNDKLKKMQLFLWKFSFHTEKNTPNQPILMSEKQIWGGFFLTWQPSQMQKLGQAFLHLHLASEIITPKAGTHLSYAYGKLLKGRVWPRGKKQLQKKNRGSSALPD